MKLRWHLCLTLSLFVLLERANSQTATGFNYSGKLNANGVAASGVYDFEFLIFDSNVGGNQQGISTTNLSVAVTNGVFNAIVDAGNIFNGDYRWLDISVRTNGANIFTHLSPRQQVLPTPYAQYSITAGSFAGTIPLTNLPASVALLTSNQYFNGTVHAASFSGDGSGLTNLPPTVLITNSSGLIPSIQNFGARGGTNDDTLAVQSAANYGQPVYFPPNFPVMCSNIFLASGTQFIGNKTVITFNPNATGVMFQGSAAIHGVVLKGLIFEGAYVGDLGSGDGDIMSAWNYQGYLATAGIAARQGVLRTATEMNANDNTSEVSDCTAQNFSDTGFRFIGGIGSFPQPITLATRFHHCGAINNYVGFAWTNNAEYMCPDSLNGTRNGIGISLAAGNINISGGLFTRNGIAVWIEGANVNNPAHGTLVNVTMNHNDVGIIADNWYQGFDFIGCHLEGGGNGPNGIYLTNVTGFRFTKGILAPGLILADGSGGGGDNFITDNTQKGYWTKILVNGGKFEESGNSAIQDNNGNYFSERQTVTNSLNNYFSGSNTFNGNGAGLTNIPGVPIIQWLTNTIDGVSTSYSNTAGFPIASFEAFFKCLVNDPGTAYSTGDSIPYASLVNLNAGGQQNSSLWSAANVVGLGLPIPLQGHENLIGLLQKTSGLSGSPTSWTNFQLVFRVTSQ